MAKKKIVKKPEPKKVEEKPVVQEPQEVKAPSGPVCVECGTPVAEGQTYVCTAHIRRN